jgi:hypothetical protein
MAAKTASKQTTSKKTSAAKSAAGSPAAAVKTPALRDRIKEFRRVPANQIQADPRNWREHPPEQRSAMKAVLAEIGMADAVLAREGPDGKLILIDGHLRSDIVGDAEIPVLVLDVTEAEAAKLLATLDPLAAMASANEDKLKELLNSVQFESPGLDGLLANLNSLAGIEIDAGEEEEDETAGGGAGAGVGENVSARYSVLIDCEDEQQQQELIERFGEEGLECRALVV